MPYAIVPLKKKGHFMVVNKDTGKIHAHDTNLENARAQLRLFGMVARKKKDPYFV